MSKADEAVKLVKAYQDSGLDPQEAINAIHWASMGHDNNVEVPMSDRSILTIKTGSEKSLTPSMLPDPEEE